MTTALGPDDKVVLFMRQGCHVCARVKKFLVDNDVPFTLREVDQEPLTPKELWALFTKKASRLRVPFTVVNDGEDVVLGYDPLRLEGVLLQGDRGGWQVSTPVVDERVYDEFTGTSVDGERWTIEGDPTVVVGGGALTVTDGPATLRSLERFKTPPGSSVSLHVGLSAATAGGATITFTDTTSGLALGFRIDADGVSAVHERRLLAGVTLPEETFRHVVRIEADATVEHGYAVRYEHDTNRVEWSIDGTVVYWATTPRPLEGCSVELGLDGAGPATWTAPTLHG